MSMYLPLLPSVHITFKNHFINHIAVKRHRHYIIKCYINTNYKYVHTYRYILYNQL